eukprot:851281-Rhodomonas_salina.1
MTRTRRRRSSDHVTARDRRCLEGQQRLYRSLSCYSRSYPPTLPPIPYPIPIPYLPIYPPMPIPVSIPYSPIHPRPQTLDPRP